MGGFKREEGGSDIFLRKKEEIQAEFDVKWRGGGEEEGKEGEEEEGLVTQFFFLSEGIERGVGWEQEEE